MSRDSLCLDSFLNPTTSLSWLTSITNSNLGGLACLECCWTLDFPHAGVVTASKLSLNEDRISTCILLECWFSLSPTRHRYHHPTHDYAGSRSLIQPNYCIVIQHSRFLSRTTIMPPLTNPSFTISAASDDPPYMTLPYRPSPQLRAEEIELPSSEDEESATSASSSPQSSPLESTEPFPKHGQYLSRNTMPSGPRESSPPRRMRPPSAGGSINAPPMQRSHSSPGVDASGRYIAPYGAPRRPESPLHSGRRRSPLRMAMEEPYPGKPAWSSLAIEPNIPENEELDFTAEGDASQPSPLYSSSHTFPRSRRRAAQALHQSASAPSLHARAMSPSLSGRTSPSPFLGTQKYTYEPYPMYSISSASSVPSTPTSLRSRSPSISSLETIEDAPDAEEAAILEEEEAKVKGEDSEAGESRRRSSLEIRANNLRSNKERKRWSVCGAERRADFSLEPIEE